MTAFTVSALQETCLPISINGEYRQSAGPEIDCFDPTNGQVWCRISDCSDAEVDAAVRAAGDAMRNPAWRDITQSQRGALMLRLADILEENVERIAEIEVKDNGKLLREMRALAQALPVGLRYFAGMADKIEGTTIPVNKPDMLNFTVREPLGVIGVIIPWNSPLFMMIRAIAPALACGNSVVVKPSEHASAGAIAFAELMTQAGFPDGVFNLITGYGHSAGNALISHPGIAKIDFTGGPSTGRVIARNAAEQLTPASLELGGKSPHVVCDDADLDAAANGVVAGIFAAAGQTCVAGSRCFVQENVYDEVVEKIIEKTRAIKIGDPRSDDVQLGPLALWSQVEKVAEFVETARSQGATLAFGGGRPEGLGDGWYVEPTIFTDVTNDMHIAREEVFGPVLGILKFTDEDDLLTQANDSDFALASGIWTGNINRALRFMRRIEAGMVWINTYRSPSIMSPSGGFKDSGYGKHNGFAAIQEYSRIKTVVIDYSGAQQDAFVMRVTK
ncbi:aldehyde dehydrogenase [uncultured Ruegeria sp.]|uniref:aldehyde dehydrogenase n=1 Tax=uncultured Ruegeria sp. TaxID=259304 RepID=UPI0026264E4B|nr:aldehyde dehydrogenase [uncultured Ruegeria sp.]